MSQLLSLRHHQEQIAHLHEHAQLVFDVSSTALAGFDRPLPDGAHLA